jgi:SnoaL-like protein
MEESDNVALIRRFIEACVRAEPDEFAAYFTDDAVWWNSPWKAIEGRQAIREALRRGAERMTALPWTIHYIVSDKDRRRGSVRGSSIRVSDSHHRLLRASQRYGLQIPFPTD